MNALEIKKLKVTVSGKRIIKGLDLKIKQGEIHALMGPNGSGKSTLAAAIMGSPKVRIAGGSILVEGRKVNRLSPDKRAKLGLFLSFQYPVEISGLPIEHFTRTAYNVLHPKERLTPSDFNRVFEKNLALLKMRKDFGNRSLNEGFSGGEKKKLEMLQLAILRPKVAILDETDSGLDIDALQVVSRGIKRAKIKRMTILVITHYFRILKHIEPDKVHIMSGGRIIKSGDLKLAVQLEKKGYDRFDA